MEFIKKNKTKIFLFIVFVLLICLCMFAMYKMFYPKGGVDKYGVEVDSISTIDQLFIDEISSNITSLDISASVSGRLEGRILKFNVVLYDNISSEGTYPVLERILAMLDEDELNYHDIQVTFSNERFVSIAYKSKSAIEFSIESVDINVVEDGEVLDEEE